LAIEPQLSADSGEEKGDTWVEKEKHHILLSSGPSYCAIAMLKPLHPFCHRIPQQR